MARSVGLDGSRNQHDTCKQAMHGVDHLLSAYGGMGSINDIKASDDIGELRSRAWSLAKSIQRNSN
jgi:hypothetical protein